MNKPPAKLIPLVAAGVAPAATVTSALMSPFAMAATGDLDPAFGDLGRLGPILDGPAWSIEAADGGSTLLGGGALAYYSYYFYSYYATNFVNVITDAGQIDPTFTKDATDSIQVFDIARQTDGSVVAVGRHIAADNSADLAAFRLEPDGALDTTFASNGIFSLPVAEFGASQLGRSVVLDTDGRIVIAGSRDDQVIVLRLLPDGSLDDSFATGGIFLGPDTFDFSDDGSGARTHILRTSGGGYRVTASNGSGCQVFALTSAGAIDAAFGTGGVASVDAPSGPSTWCSSLSGQADGRLLVAGSASGQGFASRLLEDGQPDPGFAAPVVTDAMHEATTIAAGTGGTVVVAGRGVSGATIMRLQASGELDALFGNGGSTLIDLNSGSGTDTTINDMLVRADGAVLAAGGERRANKAFVIRLLGDGGGNSPGVLGVIEQDAILTDEGLTEVVVNVRRSGGSAGSVSVDYATSNVGFHSADPGEDYVHTTGTLTWDDGDTSEQQIHVPISANSVTEPAETFLLNLSNAGGGAGLGTTAAAILIEADGKPYGQFRFLEASHLIPEGQQAEVTVVRDYYDTGPVSVTLTAVAGTATAGDDFVANDVTLSWADGESGAKSAVFLSVDDSVAESTESFRVELSNPTGGALIGRESTTTILIATNDQQLSRRGSGGGALGFLSLLLLGLTRLLRTAGAAVRSRK